MTYYMHDGPTAFRFELAGILARKDAAELEQAWRTASSVIENRLLIVDLSFVTRIDEEGRDLLRKWHESGAMFVANSAASRSLLESIIGKPLPAAIAAAAPTYEPFFTRIARRAATLLSVILLGLPVFRQVPAHGRWLADTYNPVMPLSHLTLVFYQNHTNGLTNALTSIEHATQTGQS